MVRMRARKQPIPIEAADSCQKMEGISWKLAYIPQISDIRKCWSFWKRGEIVFQRRRKLNLVNRIAAMRSTFPDRFMG
jgi:hypothetical protein